MKSFVKLVLCLKKFCDNFCVRAAEIAECKFICSALIRMNLRGLAVGDLSELSRRNYSKNFGDRALIVGARGSPLSRSQIKEVEEEIKQFHPEVEFSPVFEDTIGDKDLKTSLRDLGKTDFFTHEIDFLQLNGGCRISIHSAKDLPEPLPQGLVLVALTKGVDPSDVLVFREGETIESLPAGALIGTSSIRREETMRQLRKDLQCVDIRGNIGQRLALLDQGKVDGIVMAEAALIRLHLTHRNRFFLPGPAAPFQGQLAVLACEGDEEMKELFSLIDVRTGCKQLFI